MTSEYILSVIDTIQTAKNHVKLILRSYREDYLATRKDHGPSGSVMAGNIVTYDEKLGSQVDRLQWASDRLQQAEEWVRQIYDEAREAEERRDMMFNPHIWVCRDGVMVEADPCVDPEDEKSDMEH